MEKKRNNSKYFITWTQILHRTIRALFLQELHCPFSKQFCLSLCSVKCSLVWGKGSWSNCTFVFLFLHALEFWDSSDQPSFTLFIQKIAQSLHFFVRFAENSAFTSFSRPFWSTLLSKLPLINTFLCKILVHQKACLWFGIFLEDEKSFPEYSQQTEIPSNF